MPLPKTYLAEGNGFKALVYVDDDENITGMDVRQANGELTHVERGGPGHLYQPYAFVQFRRFMESRGGRIREIVDAFPESGSPGPQVWS